MPESKLAGRIAAEWTALQREAEAGAPTPPAWLTAGRPVFPARPLALYAQLEEVLALWADLRREPLAGYAGRFVTSSWTLKDMLGHLATWAAEFRLEVETMARGGAFDYAIPYALSVMGPNAWNEAEAGRQRPVPLRTILERFEAETERLQDLVLAVPEAKLFAPGPSPLAPSGDPQATIEASIAQIVLGKCAHDRHHLGRIAGWLAQVRKHEKKKKKRRSR